MSDLNCRKRFFEIYSREAEGLAFCPYRICPIGAHSDHNLGLISGFAIDKGIHIAYRPKKNGVVEMNSLQFSKRAQWHINSTPKEKEGDWADYLRGATRSLTKKYTLSTGVCGVIDGSLPIGGLSSSAAVTLAFLSALCDVNNIHLTAREIIDIAYDAEKNYVGVSIGKLDQSCEVLCKKNNLLYLDTLDDSYELIPAPSNMKPFKIAVFFSGLEHSLVGSKYNMRVDELKAGIYALEAFSGMEYGKFKDAVARDVPRQVYDEYKDRLPQSWRNRCEHWYTEFERVKAGAEAWRAGDIEKFGKLSFESGKSSIVSWESGAPEQIKLYEIMTETDGIYGGRFAGAGFKGCCLALIDPGYEQSIREQVTKKYLEAFPYLADKYEVFICDTADGLAERDCL